MNLAKLAREKRWRPGRTRLRLTMPGGEVRMVRLTAIGETAILVRRKGTAEFAVSGYGLLDAREEFESDRPIDLVPAGGIWGIK